MPRAPKGPKPEEPQTTNTSAIAPRAATDLAPWEEEMAEEAKKAQEQLVGVGGLLKSIGTKAGIMRIGEDEVPDSQIGVVVLGFTNAKSFFGADAVYDETNKVPPVCYAFADKIEQLAPHEKCKQKQNVPMCKGCKWDAFGTAKTGKGKACKDHLRLLLVEAGTLKGDTFTRFEPEDFKNGQLYTISIPATSQALFKAYTDGLAARDRPKSPWAVFTKIKVKPHAKNQVEVTCTELDRVPMTADIWAVIKERRASSLASLTAPYPDAPEKPAETKGKKAKGGSRKFA